MTPWHREPMLAFDLETTGKDPNTARIVTATLVEVGREGVARTCEWLVDPGIEIPAGAAEIHGITTEHARAEGRDAEEAIYEITAQLGLWLGRGRPVVGMNLAYDFTVLDRECFRQGIDSLSRRLVDVEPLIDIFVLDKHCWTYRKGSRTLTALCETYEVTQDAAHTSAGDALAAARVAFKLAQAYPDDLQIPVKVLHSRQRAWCHEQCVSLQAHFRKTDPTAVVNPEWPVQSLPPGWTPELVDLEPAQNAS